MASKNRRTLNTELTHGVDLSVRDLLKDVIDSSATISGLYTSNSGIHSGSAPADPGVDGKLFLTSSAAVAGGDLVFIAVSKG